MRTVKATPRLLAVAREFSHAEVAFVFAANAPDHDVRLRFFNARKEAPFVGHATIAAHAVLLALGRRGAGVCRQHSGTGIIEVTATPAPAAGDRSSSSGRPHPTRRAAAVQDHAARGRGAAPARHPAARDHAGAHRPQGQHPASRADRRPAPLDALAPNFDTLLALGTELGADGFFVFALNRNADEWSTESRMFCPALGIPEDPVSGNAHAMLAAYLWDLGQFGKNSTDFHRPPRPADEAARAR